MNPLLVAEKLSTNTVDLSACCKMMVGCGQSVLVLLWLVFKYLLLVTSTPSAVLSFILNTSRPLALEVELFWLKRLNVFPF